MPTEIDTILNLSVPVIVQIGDRSMPLENVLALVPGAIIELPRNADDPLDLLVNNRAVGKGQAVKIGENFGIRMTAVGTSQQLVEAMAALA